LEWIFQNGQVELLLDLLYSSSMNKKSHTKLIKNVESKKEKLQGKLTVSELRARVKKFGVKGLGTPVADQDKYIYGV